MRITFKILGLIFLFVFTACSGTKEQEWLETSEGIKIYTNDTISNLFVSATYSWNGTTRYGLAHGKGKLTAKENNGKILMSKFLNAYYGNVDSESIATILKKKQGYFGDLDDDVPNGFGVLTTEDMVYIGTFEDGEGNGTVTALTHDTLYYKGEWEAGMFDGKGISYYPDGKIQYQGKWSKGLYNGKGTYYDEQGVAHRHVWKDGALKEKTQILYERLISHKDELSEKTYNSLKNTFYYWEVAYIWVYVAVGLLLLLLVWALNKQYENFELTRYYETEPLPSSTVRLTWLLGGWLGWHRARLTSSSYILQYLLFASLVIANVDNLFLYILHPSVWFILPHFGVFTKIAILIMLCWWIIDGCMISYLTYVYVAKYFQRSEYEQDILQGKKTEIEAFYEQLASKTDDRNRQLEQLLQEARECSQRVNPAGTWTKRLGGGLDFEKSRFAEMQEIGNKMNTIYNSFELDCTLIDSYLGLARISVYRNLYLAKELIQLIHKMSGKEQTIQQDNLNFSQVEIDLHLPENLNMDIDAAIGNTITNACNSYSMMLKNGFGNKVAVAGAALSLIESAINIIDSRNEQREAMAQRALEIVQDMDKGIKELMVNEGKLLRASELLSALFNANKAFVKAYAELRDICFGDISYENYRRGPLKDSAIYDTVKFKQSMQHLVMVCSEYNKINKQTINVINDERKQESSN